MDVFFYTHLSMSPKFLMTLNVCSTNESVCLTEPLRDRCLPNMNRPRSPFCCRPNMFGTSSPFWHSLQWNAPMKNRRRDTPGTVRTIRTQNEQNQTITIVAIIVHIRWTHRRPDERRDRTARPRFCYPRALTHGLNQSQNMITVGTAP